MLNGCKDLCNILGLPACELRIPRLVPLQSNPLQHDMQDIDHLDPSGLDLHVNIVLVHRD